MKVTHCPTAYAWGYQNTANVVDGFFASRGLSVAARRMYGSATTRIPEDAAIGQSSSFSIGDLINSSTGKKMK